jgi:hypothetical protein
MRLALALAGLITTAALPTAAADPLPVPDEAAIEALATGHPRGTPAAARPGAVRLTEAADERDLNRGFLDDLEALPDWANIAIVVASGTFASSRWPKPSPARTSSPAPRAPAGSPPRSWSTTAPPWSSTPSPCAWSRTPAR